MTSAKHTVVSWTDVETQVEALAATIRSGRAPVDRIVGVARGGMIPAVLLAARLGVRRVESVQVIHYDGTRRFAEPCVREPLPRAGGTETLVVDDVLETGGTFRCLRTHLPDSRFAALFAKGDTDVDLLVGLRVPPERWLVFPWSDGSER
jgi:xanthine phosphoribosyltransferase